MHTSMRTHRFTLHALLLPWRLRKFWSNYSRMNLREHRDNGQPSHRMRFNNNPQVHRLVCSGGQRLTAGRIYR
jgi:hypothetical protein